MMRIVIDAMGSDQHPIPEILAAHQMITQDGKDILLVGNYEVISQKMIELSVTIPSQNILDAPDILEMNDKPVDSARKKPRNSMAVGIDLIKNGNASAFFTAGNTGAAMFTGLKTLGRINGVLRPAMPALFPVINGYCVVLDIGANADCRPEFLEQFAIMGSIYAEKMLGKVNPRVGLLSNGEEPGKGNQLIKDSYPLLENANINFIGNVEAKEVFQGLVDVAVTDGFTGNIFLKGSEAVAKMLIDILKIELTSNIRTSLGAMLAKPAFTKIRKMMDPREIGAAPLLGIDGLIFVGHGRSDQRAIINAIRIAEQAVGKNIQSALSEAIQNRVNI
jgi:phosphate acyltransferase